MNSNTPISALKGIGDKTNKLMENIGVYTIGDMLLYFPLDYIRYPEPVSVDEVESDEYMAIYGVITTPPYKRGYQKNALVTCTIAGINKRLNLTWFHQPYIINKLHVGDSYVFYGRIIQKNHTYMMSQPKMFALEEYERQRVYLQPVYSLTGGLSNNNLMKYVNQILEEKVVFHDPFSPQYINEHDLMEINEAIRILHQPENLEALKCAKQRIIYDEFFYFILRSKLAGQNLQLAQTSYRLRYQETIDELLEYLPYKLTQGQNQSLHEILEDLGKPEPMQRLLQGDVGSGKTIVAFLCMVLASKNGYQSAIMTPTEILSNQHYASFIELKAMLNLDIPILLLTGSLTAKKKKEMQETISKTSGAIIVGTQALIQEKVNYNQLAFIITDEQHRFGVKQRELLAKKDDHPHVLVMSATPIPRTLAIILYGNLSISQIKELPASRKPIKNVVIKKNERIKAYKFIEKQVKQGHQAYVICHLVEESEALSYQSIERYAPILREALGPQISVGILHGKMKADEKDRAMKKFEAGEIDVLLSTTVVEVGVNVPNATLMVIEDAQGFGLAQIHQLRGRVGRGEAQSYCIMINTTIGGGDNERLDICNHSNDGFYIAQKDMELRGSGDFFGVRQSGLEQFVLGDIYRDQDLLQKASADAENYYANNRAIVDQLLEDAKELYKFGDYRSVL